MGIVLNPPSGGLLGRDREMAVLQQGLEAARDSSATALLVAGDAGIGKTRLLTELVSRSDERALWGGCLPLGERGVAYLPLIEMIRSLDDDVRDTLPPVLEAIAPRGRQVVGDAGGSRAHLFQAVLELLEDLAASAPLIVVVEDLHWADRSTLDLLDFLIALLRDQRILLLCSIRTDDLPPDHPLRTDVAEWLRRPSVRWLGLEPLSPEDGMRLVAALLAEPEMTREQAMRLVQRADGNPFLIEELVAAGSGAVGTPERMRDLLLRRTHGLSADLTRLLRIASVAGTEIDERLLSKVAGLTLADTRALLRAGISAQLLVVDERGCRFRHALVAEALHGDLLPAEHREYHAAYADALVAGDDPVPAGALASHQAEAGRSREALTAWVRAAEAATGQYAFAEAQHGYQSALDLWREVEEPDAAAGFSHLELLRRLGDAAFLAGDPHVACWSARAALDEVDEVDDPVTAGLIHHRLARYVRNTDDYADALALQKRAVELVPESPSSPERAEVLAGLALILQYENRYREARDISEQAIEVAVETGAREAETRARNTLGETICILEDLDRGLSVIGEALELARQTGNAHEQARSLWNMQANRFFGGRLAEFVDTAGSTIETLRITQPHWILDHLVDTADALQMLGRWDEADAVIATARREYPTMADRIGIRELLVARGQLDEARALVEAQTLSLVGYVGPDVTGRVLNMVHQAEVEVAEGNPSRAIELIAGALELYRDVEKPIYIGHGLVVGLRAAADLARSARLRNLSAQVHEAMEVGEAFHGRMAEVISRPGPANGWKREVGCLAAQGDAELARLHGRRDPAAWMRADDCWTALSMPYRAARCRFRWAEDALASGVDRSVVEPVIEELREYLQHLGAKPLLDDVVALARRARIDGDHRTSFLPYGLTGREREVLAQVASGATNRQIAEALYISEKTASVHVSNILRKLTASNRSEAAAKAVKEGLVGFADPPPR
ncbi:helix-turn-helix transcriptional regulator [Intrasporangium sp.]|uniref:helix-turn-helix transcriptional regulator n=1 Tax=Intrasporangium sp. TaxID=1925024 RepID=UPI002939DE9D|nr:AAA family ATPase [Intrasporangium sp.]MDV3219986.1 AAA family ATPase [Intrasporangium sp.]